MDQSASVPSSNLTPQNLDKEEIEGSQAHLNEESKIMLDCSLTHGNEEKSSLVDERNTRGKPTVDTAEVLRRWTHALLRIHKQSLQLVCAVMQASRKKCFLSFLLGAQTNPIENITEKKSLEQPPSNSLMGDQHDEDIIFLQNLKRSVRESALSSQSCNLESSQDCRSDDSSEHFFIPLSETNSSHLMNKYSGSADTYNDLDSYDEYDGADGFLSTVGSKSPVSDAYRSFFDMDKAQDQVFSPSLLMDAATWPDSYEDLLALLSDTEIALMEH